MTIHTHTGTVPKDASFGMQALLTFHFVNGGYYPVGGASEIAFNIIPTIEAAGGKVLVRARVTDILFDEGTNRVTGVRVKQGHTVYEILAPLVISDAGVHNTFESLLPKEAVKKFKLKQLLKRVRHGFGLMSVFIGLDGTKEELGLKASNTWAFRDADLDKAVDDYISLTPEEAMTAEVPLMFVSFPSTKDPTYNERYPGKTTCTIVTMTPYEWFEEWKDGRVQHRGQEYDALKNAIATQMWNQVCLCVCVCVCVFILCGFEMSQFDCTYRCVTFTPSSRDVKNTWMSVPPLAISTISEPHRGRCTVWTTILLDSPPGLSLTFDLMSVYLVYT